MSDAQLEEALSPVEVEAKKIVLKIGTFEIESPPSHGEPAAVFGSSIRIDGKETALRIKEIRIVGEVDNVWRVFLEVLP